MCRRIISIAFVLLFVFMCLQKVNAQHVTGTNYYIDSISGNDANTGLSDATAWQSLSNVNKTAFKPGD